MNGKVTHSAGAERTVSHAAKIEFVPRLSIYTEGACLSVPAVVLFGILYRQGGCAQAQAQAACVLMHILAITGSGIMTVCARMFLLQRQVGQPTRSVAPA